MTSPIETPSSLLVECSACGSRNGRVTHHPGVPLSIKTCLPCGAVTPFTLRCYRVGDLCPKCHHAIVQRPGDDKLSCERCGFWTYHIEERIL